MKVLFLDIDGVLNSHRTALAFGGIPWRLSQKEALDPVALALLQNLCRADAEVRVVVSSVWRKYHNVEEFRVWLDLPVIGVTPVLQAKRGYEIQQWLDAHQDVTEYVIIDDDSDMLDSQMGRFIKVDGAEGLSFSNYQDAGRLLKLDIFSYRPNTPWAVEPKHENGG